MIYYLDASALLKVYFHEKGSELMVKLLKSGVFFFSSIVIYVEVLFALRRRLENKEISDDYLSEQTRLFEAHFPALINRIEFNEHIISILKSKVFQYPMKALDVIHLASALWVRENIEDKCKFLSSDKDLLEFVKKEKFYIVNPEEGI